MLFLLSIWNLSSAKEINGLFFPDKPEEIVQILGQTPNINITHQCPKAIPNCESKTRRLPKGIRDIVSDNPDLPRAGALIHFDFDSATIRSANSYELLGHYGKALQTEKLKNAVLVIAGHTDYIGTETYNQGLSERRAKAVKNFLTTIYLIKPHRLHEVGFGETQPIRGTRFHQTAEERKWNRRVEFIRIE
jgi:outer membrane protein OmpA-like peptidoglycan-associated protein